MYCTDINVAKMDFSFLYKNLGKNKCVNITEFPKFFCSYLECYILTKMWWMTPVRSTQEV